MNYFALLSSDTELIGLRTLPDKGLVLHIYAIGILSFYEFKLLKNLFVKIMSLAYAECIFNFRVRLNLAVDFIQKIRTMLHFLILPNGH